MDKAITTYIDKESMIFFGGGGGANDVITNGICL